MRKKTHGEASAWSSGSLRITGEFLRRKKWVFCCTDLCRYKFVAQHCLFYRRLLSKSTWETAFHTFYGDISRRPKECRKTQKWIYGKASVRIGVAARWKQWHSSSLLQYAPAQSSYVEYASIRRSSIIARLHSWDAFTSLGGTLGAYDDSFMRRMLFSGAAVSPVALVRVQPFRIQQ